jgi:ABC-type nitrate/sulfonate/bicarbonate transport system substrate-binding protein
MAAPAPLNPLLSRRSLLRAAGLTGVAAGGSLLLAACGAKASTSSAGSKSLGAASIQLSWIKNYEFVGEYMATEKGYYKSAGFQSVDLLAGGTSTTAESIVLAGKATVGLSSPPITAASILNSGAPLKIIGATYQKNPFAIESIGSITPIRTPKDMIGKKIGVQSGGNQTLFEGLLKANGISKSDLEIVGVEYDNTVLKQGKVDGFMSYVTGDISLKEEKLDGLVMSFADNGLPFVAETFTVTQDSIDKNRELLKALLVAEIKGWHDAILDPATACAYAVQKYGKDQNLVWGEQYAPAVELAKELIVSDDTNANGLFTMTDELVSQNIASLKTMGYDIAADKLFDLSLIDEVYKEHPELIKQITAPSDLTVPKMPTV